MGRVKLHLKKIRNKTKRQITFAKRKTGLLNKAHELSTICDVELVLILFAPSGKLILYEGKKSAEEILQRFIDSPANKRGWVANEEMVRDIIAKMNLEADFHQHFSASSSGNRPVAVLSIDSELEEMQKKIIEYSAQLQAMDEEMEVYLKFPTDIQTQAEWEQHLKLLEDTLQAVRKRRAELEAQEAMRPTPETSASSSTSTTTAAGGI